MCSSDSSEPRLLDEDYCSLDDWVYPQNSNTTEINSAYRYARTTHIPHSVACKYWRSATYPHSNCCWLPLHQQESRDDEASTEFSFKAPKVCFNGIERGNHSLLHHKAWLEASDPKHRYGKHLRIYHREWESLPMLEKGSVVNSSFFDWLNSKGIFAGQPLPEVAACPRSQLDSDTVQYINDARESQHYAVHLQVNRQERRGVFVFAATGMPVRTGPSGWMFVLRDDIWYAAPKISTSGYATSAGTPPQRFHHSSFFGGRAVQAAGIFVTCDRKGSLVRILPHSGHYRPREADVQRLLSYLSFKRICLTTFHVDVQLFLRINRCTSMHQKVESSIDICEIVGKKKKVESMYLRSAIIVADYLSHKARCLQHGIFAEIEARRV